MNTYIIKEHALTDDLLHVAPKGQQFTRGYLYVIEYFTYLNSQSDKRNYRRFRTKNSLTKYMNKNYPEFDGEIEQ